MTSFGMLPLAGLELQFQAHSRQAEHRFVDRIARSGYSRNEVGRARLRQVSHSETTRYAIRESSVPRVHVHRGEGVTRSEISPSFDNDIKPLFRESDRSAMLSRFDLWSFDDVRNNADAILASVSNGVMPCDGKWPDEKVGLFQRWVESGAQR
jgi:hypothetical protein